MLVPYICFKILLIHEILKSREMDVAVHCGSSAKTSLEQSQRDNLGLGESENRYPLMKSKQFFQG